MTRFRIASLVVALAGISTGAFAARPAFDVARIYGKSFSEVVSVLKRAGGSQRSQGTGQSFVEFSLPSAGVFVLFERGKATVITTTFRRPYSTPTAALAGIGLNAGGRKPQQSNAVLRQWKGLGRAKTVTVRSNDGKTWGTVEVGSVR